jgi:AraC-like DNA-binding protein
VLQASFRSPAPGLDPFVRFYVQRQVRIRDSALVHPVPARATPMIVFEFGDPTDVLDHGEQAPRRSPRVVVVGPQTYPRVEMHLLGTLESFAIMFQPDGLHRLFSIPMHELADRDYEAHSVLGSYISRLREILGNSESFQERVDLINQSLLRHALQSRSSDGISAAANQMMLPGGRTGISAFANLSGLGLRQFQRRFVQRVGIPPKLFARIARFEAALENKARFAARSWTDVAHDFGYFDQMHMVHDFAEFTGKTPTETLVQLEAVFADQITAVRSARPCSTAGDSRLIL